jgi:hypothetical protein
MFQERFRALLWYKAKVVGIGLSVRLFRSSDAAGYAESL